MGYHSNQIELECYLYQKDSYKKVFTKVCTDC